MSATVKSTPIWARPQRHLDQAMLGELLIDGRVDACGDDINFVLTHKHGVDSMPRQPVEDVRAPGAAA
jgi:fructose 1,6-bisphosphatase